MRLWAASPAWNSFCRSSSCTFVVCRSACVSVFPMTSRIKLFGMQGRSCCWVRQRVVDVHLMNEVNIFPEPSFLFCEDSRTTDLKCAQAHVLVRLLLRDNNSLSAAFASMDFFKKATEICSSFLGFQPKSNVPKSSNNPRQRQHGSRITYVRVCIILSDSSVFQNVVFRDTAAQTQIQEDKETGFSASPHKKTRT